MSGVDTRSPALAYATKDNIAIPTEHSLSATQVGQAAADRDADNKGRPTNVITHAPGTDTIQKQYVPVKAPN